MTAEDADVIRRFAAGDEGLRPRAVQIFHDECRIESRKRRPDVRSTPEMRFMAEVDNPCPDYTLRAMYRRRLLEGR